MIFLEQQLSFLEYLKQGRGAWIDPLFQALNYFDSQYFYCLLVAFVWIGCSARWGIRLGFLMVASGFVTILAKSSFDLPRPGHFDPLLPLAFAKGYGFPSGGAQNAMLLGLLLMTYWKSRWAKPIGLFYLLLISFSRLFLGVHFPVDVVGGWACGLLLYLCFRRAVAPLERVSQRHPEEMLVAALAFVCFFHLFVPRFEAPFVPASLFATAVGVYLSHRYRLYQPLPPKIATRVFLGLFGVAVSGMVALAARQFGASQVGQVMAVGLWVSLGASPFCRRVFYGKK